MRKKKRHPGYCLFLVTLTNLHIPAQTIPVELMTGHQYIWYQHSVSKSINNSSFAFFNTSSLIAPYKKERKSELMSQSYLTYALHPDMKIGLGSFYATVPRFSPSINIQFLKAGKNYLLLIVPRIDLKWKPTHDVMLLIEYKAPLNQQLKLHTRFQTMLNFTGSTHNRSYQNFRLGIAFGNVQAGFALNLDAYGARFNYLRNYGVYLKKDLH